MDEEKKVLIHYNNSTCFSFTKSNVEKKTLTKV